jgi:hypothetical protein
MSDAVSNSNPSNFVWYEFHTPDAASAAAFYQPVLGWTTSDSGKTDQSYTLLNVNNIAIGGLLQKPAASFISGTTPGWIGYIGVADLDTFLGKHQKLGGIVHRAAETIPEVGSFAVVADPQGAIFVLFQPPNVQQQPERPKPGSPGSPAWHDLAAIDWATDFEYYADMFGWTKSTAMDMGPNGVYQIFASGQQLIGGMMTRMDPNQPPGWLFYFHVEPDIQKAIDRVKQHGGIIVHGPSEVPGGQQIAHCLDPQGAIFGIVTPGA